MTFDIFFYLLYRSRGMGEFFVSLAPAITRAQESKIFGKFFWPLGTKNLSKPEAPILKSWERVILPLRGGKKIPLLWPDHAIKMGGGHELKDAELISVFNSIYEEPGLSKKKGYKSPLSANE